MLQNLEKCLTHPIVGISALTVASYFSLYNLNNFRIVPHFINGVRTFIIGALFLWNLTDELYGRNETLADNTEVESDSKITSNKQKYSNFLLLSAYRTCLYWGINATSHLECLQPFLFAASIFSTRNIFVFAYYLSCSLIFQKETPLTRTVFATAVNIASTSAAVSLLPAWVEETGTQYIIGDISIICISKFFNLSPYPIYSKGDNDSERVVLN